MRTSEGIGFSDFFTSKGRVEIGTDILEVSGLNERDSFAFLLKHEGYGLKEDSPVHVQVAVLYTRGSKRRVRVINHTVYATTVAKTVIFFFSLSPI